MFRDCSLLIMGCGAGKYSGGRVKIQWSGYRERIVIGICLGTVHY